MMKEPNTKNKLYLLVIFGALLVIGTFYIIRSGPTVNELDTTGWKVSTTATTTFKYPQDFNTAYISTVDWPPQVQVLAGPVTCTEAGSEIAQAGQTAKESINGREYCVTKESGGAAGSIYTQYAYAFDKSGQTAILAFSLRFPQCPNYDEPRRTECETERAAFNPNNVVDAMAQSLELK